MDHLPAAGAARPADPPLRPVRFDTDDLPAPLRFEAWHGAFSSVNRIHLPEGGQRDFSARNENWRLGDMLFTRNRTPALGFERSPRLLRRDGLDHFVLRLLLRGQSRSRTGDAVHEAGPGDLFAFHLGEAWESRWSAAEWVSLCIPREAMPRLAEALDPLGSGVLREAGAGLLAEYLALLGRRLEGATLGELPSLTRATEAMVLASLMREGVPEAGLEEAVARSQFARARRMIQRHLGEASLTPERLARQCGLARSSLYRCFEPHGGVARFIQAERLRQVRRLLADPACAAVPVARLAERVGFFDASAFSRLFRRSQGCSPRDFRQMALAGRDMEVQGAALPEESFGAMLRALGR
jgi:AraC-like DNA-binding protein